MTGKEIRELRKKLGLTQEEMGTELGVAQMTIRRWELGWHSPSHLALEKLVLLCQRAEEQVLGGE